MELRGPEENIDSDASPSRFGCGYMDNFLIAHIPTAQQIVRRRVVTRARSRRPVRCFRALFLVSHSMKIGLFTELFPPSLGGQEIRFEHLAQLLSARNHHVSVYCVAHGTGLLAEESRDRYRVFRHPVSLDYTQPKFPPGKRNIFAILRYAAWTRGILSREHFDLVIMNQWPYLHILFAPIEARRRMLVDWCEVRQPLIYRWAQRALPPMVAANMAVNIAVGQAIEAQSGQSAFYLPSGIYLSEYWSAPAFERRDLVYLGRLVQHKNMPLLIEAFELAADAGYRFNLVIAGGGPAENAVRARAALSRHASQIRVLGRIDDATKVNLLARADALLIASKREGFPRVIAEAMASGTPTVTVDYPESAAKEVVRRYNIGLVAAPDSKSFAESICSTLANRAAFAESCLSRAPELDWSNLISKIETAIPQLLNAK